MQILAQTLGQQIKKTFNKKVPALLGKQRREKHIAMLELKGEMKQTLRFRKSTLLQRCQANIPKKI